MFTITDHRVLKFTLDILFRSDGQESSTTSLMTVFDTALTSQHLSIDKYLERLSRYMKSGSLVAVTAAVLLRRLHAMKSWLFSKSSAHRLLLAIYVIAIKWTDDVHIANSYYAKVGGIELSELNYLELCALQYLDYRCACLNTHRQETVDWANALKAFWQATNAPNVSMSTAANEDTDFVMTTRTSSTETNNVVTNDKKCALATESTNK